MQQIATADGLTPRQVFQRMQSDDAKPQVSPGGGGWGRKTVDGICAQYAIPLDTAVNRLAAAGFTATGTTTLKDLALGAGKTPLDVAKIVVGAPPVGWLLVGYPAAGSPARGRRSLGATMSARP